MWKGAFDEDHYSKLSLSNRLPNIQNLQSVGFDKVVKTNNIRNLVTNANLCLPSFLLLFSGFMLYALGVMRMKPPTWRREFTVYPWDI